MTEKNKTTASYSSLKGFHRAVPIILYAVAVFTLFCFISKDMGIFGNAISGLFLGLFSYGAYALPLLISLHAVFYPSDLEEKRIVSRVIFSLVTVVAISALSYTITYWNDELVFSAKEFYTNGQQSIGGGFIGSTVGFCLIKAFSKIGLVIIAAATFAIYISYFFAKGQKGITNVIIMILRVIVILCEKFCEMIMSLFGKVKNAKSEKKQRAVEQKSLELTEDEFFGVDNGMQKLDIPDLGIRETKTKETLEANPTLQEKVFHKSGVSQEEAEEMEEREMRELAARMFAEEREARERANAYREPTERTEAQRRKTINLNYGDLLDNEVPESSDRADIIAETPVETRVAEPVAMPAAEPASVFVSDESADSIFTRDFDPFKMLISDELASKPSSRSLLDDAPASRTVNEDISEMTEAEIERLKRISDFEKRKAALTNSRKATPVNNGGEFTGTQKNVDFREHSSESYGRITEHDRSMSVRIEKSADLPKAEPARYTSISGDGYVTFTEPTDRNAFTSPETIYFHEEPVAVIYERPAPAKEPTASVYEEPKAPVYETPAPAQTYQEEPKAPVYEAPKEEPSIPIYERPAPVAQPAAPVYEAPKEEPAVPIYERPAPVAQPAAPVYEAPKEEPAAVIYEHPAPVAEPAAPVYEATKEEPAAVIYERPAPVAQSAAPVYEATKEEPAAAIYERPAPVAQPAAPIETYQAAPEATASETEPATSVYVSTANTDNGQSEDYVPQFKPYQPTASVETNEVKTEEEDEAEAEVNTLKISRTLVSDDDDTLTVASPKNEDFVVEDPYSVDDGDEEDDENEVTDADLDQGARDDGDGFNTKEIPPEEQNPVVQAYKDMFSAIRDEEPEEEDDHFSDGQLVSPDEVQDEPDDADDYTDDGEDEDEDDPPFEASTVARTAHAEKPKAESEPPAKKKPNYSNYKTPPIELLGLDPVVDDDNSEITENTNTLIDTLASFNVTASIKGVDRGPRITRYEVVPARGVKVQSITSLFNDITLNLAKEGVRMEAPIPGKSAVGFEIPNKQPKNVRLRELLECDKFINATSKTFVAIGKNVGGDAIFGDIAKYPHVLICGATGMGKSVCINSILVSMLYKARPDEVKLIMIDPKKVEFTLYSDIPHLLIPVITEPKQAAGALMWACGEMDRRYEIIEKYRIRNIQAYNEKVANDPSIGEPLPTIIIVIDELADLMMQVRDPVENQIMRIAQKARAAGIHLLIGTQRPSVQVITGGIKANIPSRISCKVTSQVDSRTVFDVGGAEKLLDRGDMLYWPVDRTAPLRVQGAFVSDSEVEAVMQFIKDNTDGNNYDDSVMTEINKAAQKCGNKKGGGGISADDIADDDQKCGYYSDPQFIDAVELAIRSKKISTSLLQRKLSIGYGKAAKFIDAMEEVGVVSPPNGQKPRDVLMTMDEWHERLARIDLG